MPRSTPDDSRLGDFSDTKTKCTRCGEEFETEEKYKEHDCNG